MVVRLAILVCAASARSPADLLKKARNEPFDFVFVNPYDAPREILWLGPGAAEPVPMGAATFGSLSLRLGQQYLFVHHGDCEHSIVFTRCALAVESDPRDSRQYPRLVWETHGQATTHGVTRAESVA